MPANITKYLRCVNLDRHPTRTHDPGCAVAAAWLVLRLVELMLRSALCAAYFLCFHVYYRPTKLYLWRYSRSASSPARRQPVVRVSNVSHKRLLRWSVEIPIADEIALCRYPAASTAQHDEIFLVSTPKRGVINVGPTTTVRGDPLGLFRRTKS